MTQKKGSKNKNLEIWKQAIKVASGNKNLVPVKIFDAIVKEGTQNPSTLTCFVDSLDSSTKDLEVRYMLCVSDGETETPADNSIVTIAMTSFTDPYIVRSTELKDYFIVVGSQGFNNDGNVQTFKSFVDSESGSFGGFLKLIDPNSETSGTLYRINQIEDRLNTLINFWNTFCTDYIPGSPTFTGLPATLATDTVNPISPTTQRSDLENPNITHELTLNPS